MTLENGPFLFERNSTSLKLNEFAWTQETKRRTKSRLMMCFLIIIIKVKIFISTNNLSTLCYNCALKVLELWPIDTLPASPLQFRVVHAEAIFLGKECIKVVPRHG